jgi:hypothetical protein
VAGVGGFRRLACCDGVIRGGRWAERCWGLGARGPSAFHWGMRQMETQRVVRVGWQAWKCRATSHETAFPKEELRLERYRALSTDGGWRHSGRRYHEQGRAGRCWAGELLMGGCVFVLLMGGRGGFGGLRGVVAVRCTRMSIGGLVADVAARRQQWLSITRLQAGRRCERACVSGATS